MQPEISDQIFYSFLTGGLCSSSTSSTTTSLFSPFAIEDKVAEDKALASLRNHKEAERKRRERINFHLNKLRNLLSCNSKIPSNCCLCSVFVESRDHLLLRCGFSAQIWHWLQVRLRLSPCIFYTWNALLAWTRLKTDSSPPILRKLAAQAVVYHIWKQRNNVLHNHVSRLPSAICNDIDQEVRNSITARRFRKQFRDLMILWIS